MERQDGSNTDNCDLLLDIRGTAVYLGTTERHVRELRARRELPVVKIGSRLVRFKREDLDRYVAARREPARRGPIAEPYGSRR
jgi:excisionase family DNA binding protein